MFERESRTVYEFLALNDLQPGMELGLSIWHELLGRVAEPGITLKKRDVKFIQAFELEGVVVSQVKESWSVTDEARASFEAETNGALTSSPGVRRFLLQQDTTRLLPDLKKVSGERSLDRSDDSFDTMMREARDFRRRTDQIKQRWASANVPHVDALMEDLNEIERGHRPDFSSYDTRSLDEVRALVELHRKRLNLFHRLVRRLK